MPDAITLSPAPIIATNPNTRYVDGMIASWLDAKVRRTESERTRQIYRDTLASFRVAVLARYTDIDLNGDPRLIAPLALPWSNQGKAGRVLSPSSAKQRLAVVSS